MPGVDIRKYPKMKEKGDEPVKPTAFSGDYRASGDFLEFCVHNIVIVRALG